MNEITILMHLLSKKENDLQIGASKDEIIKKLNIRGKNESIYFHNLIIQLSNYLEPLGLQIRFNLLNSRWYVAFEKATSDLIYANPFEGKLRLGATLFYVLVCCLRNFGNGKIHEIEKLRNKKTVIEDLKDLRKRGYIEINMDLGQVRLTPLIGYQLDLNKLFITLALKLKQEKQ